MKGEVKKMEAQALEKKSLSKRYFSASLSLKRTLAQQFFVSHAYIHKSVHVGRMSERRLM